MVVEGVAMEKERAVVNVQDGIRTKELDNNFFRRRGAAELEWGGSLSSTGDIDREPPFLHTPFSRRAHRV